MRDSNPTDHSTGLHAPLPNRLADSPTALFVYGTLQFEIVLSGLIGRVPQRQPTTTLGWRAAALEGRVYPGLVSAPGCEARGLLLTGMSEREWRVLDAFEDDRYDLQRIEVTCRSVAWGYVWPGGEVKAEDWDAAEFQECHLQAYAGRCARIASELAARAGC
ncbi:gamma-glutamylcyclotransferase family protein [Streptomyces sp. NPDC059894]|uniref:gamma-glutamylcyclotransferase family protein n=1 Tax=unclassified Streptomyces TaxID=2593676 RepID=UPI003645FACD